MFPSTLAELKAAFEAKLGRPVCLQSPYKLCDFKALYGFLFAEYLEGYEFWGHCDTDLIFGDFSLFVTDDILAKYDRVFSRGPLSLYRNTREVNEYFKKSEGFEGVPSWKEVITSPQGFAFDEWAGVSLIWKGLDPDRMYDDIVFDDINSLSYHFLSYQKERSGEDANKGNFIFEYDHGHLYRHGINKQTKEMFKEETLFVHFEKRPMRVETADCQHYLCKPNSFVDYQSVTLGLLRRWGRKHLLYAEYFRIRLRNLKKKVFKR